MENQGLGPYIDFNDRMLRVLFHPRAVRKAPLHQRQIQRILVACYNLDIFRRLLSEVPVFDELRIPREDRGAILDDELRLLAFGHEFLEKTLFPPPQELLR